MAKTKKLNVTRRSFLLGGTAALVGAGTTIAVPGCNRKKEGSTEGGGQIVAGLAYQCTTFNPVGQANALALAANWHVLEGLYNIDYHTYKTYNGLAALSPNKLNDHCYEVVLRDNAKFSDGSDVTADDVVNAFEANMHNSTYSPFLEFIKTVAKKDNKTITFTLNYPFENLIEQRLALVTIYPKSMSESELNKKPIGSGPYTYKEVDGTNGNKLVFGKNEHYEGKFVADSDEMIWNVMTDNTPRTTAITERTSLAIESVPETNEGQIKSSGATVEYQQSFGNLMIMFNALKSPLNNEKVRQAIFYALDTQSMIDRVLEGHATPSTSILPKNHPNYHRASTVFNYDPEKAKALLKEAGHESFSFTLKCQPNWAKDLMPFIQNDLKNVGIDCQLDIKVIDWNGITDPTGVPNYDAVVTPGDQSVFGNDPDLLISYWYGDGLFMNARCCWKRANPQKYAELADLMQRARECTSSSTQQSLWNQCYDIIAENCPMYPIFHRELGTAYIADQLQNFRPISTTGLVFLGASAKGK